LQKEQKSRQNGSVFFLFHRLNPWNGKAIIPQVKLGGALMMTTKSVTWQIHYSTG